MKTSVYKIGHVLIELNMLDEMLMPENMEKFQLQTESGQAADVSLQESIRLRYFLDFTDDIIAKANELFARKAAGKEAAGKEAVRNNIHVFQTDIGECRVIHFLGHELPYAVSIEEKAAKIAKVWFRKDVAHMLTHDTVFVSTLFLEKLMIEKDSLILHSAYMNYNGKAVLFSAPSETGKSTQANLWEKYRGTYTVNGDRSLLIREGDGWYAYGWPICGSSEICRNEIYPIRAIVMLKQAKENKAYPLKGFQALREVMEQITINTWDSDFQIKAMDQLELLLEEVPVYKLECDISEGAVNCLEEVLS